MNPEWVTDILVLSFFAYVFIGALFVMGYLFLRWRKVKFTFEQAIYFVGVAFILSASAMSFGSTPPPRFIPFVSLFFLVQGAVLMILGYWKEQRNKRKLQELKKIHTTD